MATRRLSLPPALARQVRTRFGPHRRRGWERRLDDFAERLSHWSIGLTPQGLSLQEGLRAAAACALVVALMEWRHWPPLSWAAVSALWTCLADPGGATWRRFKVLMGYTLASTLFAMAGAGAAGLGLAWSASTLFVCALAGGAASVWGPAARQAGILALVACAVAIDSPKAHLADLLQFGAIFAGGCLWAVMLSVTIWRIHPFRPGRQAAAEAFTAMAALVTDLGARAARTSEQAADIAVWARVMVKRRAAVRSAIEACRTAIDELLRAQRRGPMVDRLILALAMAERIFAELIALDDIVESARGMGSARARARHIRVVALMLRRLAHWLRSGSAHDLEAEIKIAALLHDDHWTGSTVLQAIADDILAFGRGASEPSSDRGHGAPGPADAGLLAPLIAELRPGSPILRHVVRGAVLVTAALIAVHSLGLPRAYWATMAVILVHQSGFATTWPRALERSLGSLVGGAIAIVVSWTLASPVLITVAVFPLAMLTMAMRRVNYTLFVVFLTPLFVLLSGLAQPGADHMTLAWYRVANNVLGCAVALGGAALLWPVKESLRLGEAIAAALEANGRYAALVFRDGVDAELRDDARRAAGLASVNAERSCDRAALEAPRRGGGLEHAAEILVILRQLTGGVTSVWLHPVDGAAPGDDFAAGIDAATAALAVIIRRGPSAPAARLPQAAPGDTAQEQAAHRMAMLRRSVMDFVAARGAVEIDVAG